MKTKLFLVRLPYGIIGLNWTLSKDTGESTVSLTGLNSMPGISNSGNYHASDFEKYSGSILGATRASLYSLKILANRAY
jgi:hypothetical protein